MYFFRYVIECPNCGVIYRSRQYWYGNQDPVETVVRTEIQHIWPGVRSALSEPGGGWAGFKSSSLEELKSPSLLWFSIFVPFFCFLVWWLFERQQQCCSKAVGWSQIHFSVCVWTQRQTGQSGHLLADRPDRSLLLETQLSDLGKQI